MKYILHEQIGDMRDIVKEIKLRTGFTTQDALGVYKNIQLNVEYNDDLIFTLSDFYKYTMIGHPTDIFFEPWVNEVQVEEARAFYDGLSDEDKKHVDILIQINSCGPVG